MEDASIGTTDTEAGLAAFLAQYFGSRQTLNILEAEGKRALHALPHPKQGLGVARVRTETDGALTTINIVEIPIHLKCVANERGESFTTRSGTLRSLVTKRTCIPQNKRDAYTFQLVPSYFCPLEDVNTSSPIEVAPPLDASSRRKLEDFVSKSVVPLLEHKFVSRTSYSIAAEEGFHPSCAMFGLASEVNLD